jgi:3-oxoacyl-ACP reductase-like protein
MKRTLRLTAILLAALVLVAGCKKKHSDDDDDKAATTATAAPAPPPPPAPPATASAAPGPGAVAHYPDEVPLGTVTVEVLQDFAVHQAADLTSPILTHIGHGELINLKATHSNWMLLEYPSGVGQMSPGWVDMRNISDPRVRIHHGPPGLPARPVYPPRRR